MKRSTLGLILPWLVLGLGLGACVVPVELVAEADTDGTSSEDTESPADDSGTGMGTEPCPAGELGCACIDDACGPDLVCGEGECVPLAGPCGNGVVDEAEGETCDDGNRTDADGCNADCRVSGQVEWSTPLTASGETSGADTVAIDSADAIVVGGYEYFGATSHGWVRKLDPNANELWLDPLPDDVYTRELAAGPDDRIASGCTLHPPAVGFGAMWVRTYEADGSIEQTYEPGWDATDGIAWSPDGLALAGTRGRIYALGSDPPWFWEIDHGLTAMAVSPAGGFVIAGYSTDAAETSWVAWFDDATAPGEPAWSRFDTADSARGVAIDGEGNIVVVGGGMDFPTSSTWLRKLAPDGSELWSTAPSSGAASGEQALALAIDSRDRIVLVGYGDAGLSEDPWIAKLDPDGQPLWSVVLGEGSGVANAVALDSHDHIFVAASIDERARLLKLTP